MPEPKRARGLTLYLCIGRWDGFRLYRDGPSYRLVLGFVCFCVMWRDLEELLYLDSANDA